MYRSLLALLAAAPLFAFPAPKEKDAFYFATKEGTKLVYESKTKDKTDEITETVTKVESKDGVFRVSVLRENEAKKRGRSQLEVSARGIFRTSFGSREEKEPVLLLKLPAKSGETWTMDNSFFEPFVFSMTYKVGKEEEVEVPAGKFKAIPVEVTAEFRNQLSTGKSLSGNQKSAGQLIAKLGDVMSTGTYWYAPGVGVVKRIFMIEETEVTHVLKSFTQGK